MATGVASGITRRMPRPQIAIVCPATAASNNGNWRTALRWQRLLRATARVRLVPDWPDAQASQDQLMLALHARKSAPAIAAWHARHGARGLGLALTGTDIYPDITRDAVALSSLDRVASLVVLQQEALLAVPEAHRSKARVIYQSCGARQPVAKTSRHLRVVVVGHLREEKNPALLWRAIRRIPPQAGILVDHIGDALMPALAREAEATAHACPHYRWLQGLSHAATLQRIQRAHLLVHPSRSEGGALVISEAVRSGTPVLATRIPGNVGLLGAGYTGLIGPDDAQALADRLLQCRTEQAQGRTGLLAAWQGQCQERAAWFEPAAEQAALQDWISDLSA